MFASIRKLAFLCIVLCFISQGVVAASVTVKGHGTVDYESGAFSSEPDKKDIRKARKKALKKAWKKYVSKFDDAKRKAYRSLQDDFLDNINDYVIALKVVEKEVDEDSETVTVYVRVEIDDSKVQAQLSESMPQVTGNNEYFAFLFVTRQQGSITQKDDKVTSISSAETLHSASEKVKASGGSAASLDKEKTVGKTVKGGSRTSSSEKVKWVIQGSKEVDTAVKQALVNAGYKPMTYGQLPEKSCGAGAPSSDSIRNEFVKRVDITSKTKVAMQEAAQNCRVSYLGTGTLDIRKATKDPVTGNELVSVSVTAQISDTKGMFATTIGSVGPVQYKGLGGSESEARTNALLKASADLGKQLVNQLGMQK